MTADAVVRDATDADLPAILAIYNDAVAHTTAIWNETPSDLAGRKAWMDERRRAGFPVLVVDVADGDNIVGAGDLAGRRGGGDAGRDGATGVLPAGGGSRRVAGYATYGPFRPHDGYRHSVEHSIYVDAAFRGRGLGLLMLDALLVRARSAGFHVMIGGIAAENAASIRLHEKAGFERAALLREVGRKFDRWLDLQFMTKIL